MNFYFGCGDISFLVVVFIFCVYLLFLQKLFEFSLFYTNHKATHSTRVVATKRSLLERYHFGDRFCVRGEVIGEVIGSQS
jgi:hypothetical protein